MAAFAITHWPHRRCARSPTGSAISRASGRRSSTAWAHTSETGPMSDLKFEVIYPAAIPVVWRALTDPQELSEWLMPNDFRPVVGHRFTFVTAPRPDFDGIVRCEVKAVQPESLLSYSWVGGGIDTIVEWRLAAHGSGTALTLIHSG